MTDAADLCHRVEALNETAAPHLHKLSSDPTTRHRIEAFTEILNIIDRVRPLCASVDDDILKLVMQLTQSDLDRGRNVLQAIMHAEAARATARPRELSEDADIERAVGGHLDALAALPPDTTAGLCEVFNGLQSAAANDAALDSSWPLLYQLALLHEDLDAATHPSQRS